MFEFRLDEGAPEKVKNTTSKKHYAYIQASKLREATMIAVYPSGSISADVCYKVTLSSDELCDVVLGTIDCFRTTQLTAPIPEAYKLWKKDRSLITLECAEERLPRAFESAGLLFEQVTILAHRTSIVIFIYLLMTQHMQFTSNVMNVWRSHAMNYVRNMVASGLLSENQEVNAFMMRDFIDQLYTHVRTTGARDEFLCATNRMSLPPSSPSK